MNVQPGRPPPPPGARAIAIRSESPARPNYEQEYHEPQIQSIDTSSTSEPPPLTPPTTIGKAPPPTRATPGSLPARSRVPKQGQRANIQPMSKSSFPSRGRLSEFAGRLGNALSSWMNSQSPSPPLPYHMSHPPHLPKPPPPPPQQTHAEFNNSYAPARRRRHGARESTTIFESRETQSSRFPYICRIIMVG